MEVQHIQSIEISVSAISKEEKRKWVEEHAGSLQQLFEQWQKPVGIDGEEYCKYLKDELGNYCDDPLMKSLVESIT